MSKHFWWATCAILLFAATIISWRPSSSAGKLNIKADVTLSAKQLFNQYVTDLYQAAQLQQTGLAYEVFEKAVTGYTNLKLAHKLPQSSSIITVIDFNKPSHEKRMWIIDLFSKQLLLNTWVAHGQGSGDDMASRFSDRNESHQSSLGFYLADDVYIGKHGRSLRLDGMDPEFNGNARQRGIVVHAADYVSEDAIEHMGRLGRSFGCPAVSPQVSDMVINTIKGKTVFFINGNDDNYRSAYLDESGPLNLMTNADTVVNIAKL